MVSVSIVTYNVDLDELARCLRSLTSEVVSHIYVVDNAGQKRVRDFCAAYPDVTYISAPNPGYGAAHNIAIREAMKRPDAPYHLVLNSDVRFQPEVLTRLIDVMESDMSIGQLQPMVTYPDGTPQSTVRMLPTPLDVFGRRFLPSWLMRRRNARYTLANILTRSCPEPVNVPYHQGSFMLLRTDVLRDCGLFDERFFMYPEDIDLTRRIHSQRQTLWYPYERIIHDHRAGSYHNFRLLRIHVVNMIKYFNKWGWWCDPQRRAINRELRRLNESCGKQTPI